MGARETVLEWIRAEGGWTEVLAAAAVRAADEDTVSALLREAHASEMPSVDLCPEECARYAAEACVGRLAAVDSPRLVSLLAASVAYTRIDHAVRLAEQSGGVVSLAEIRGAVSGHVGVMRHGVRRWTALTRCSAGSVDVEALGVAIRDAVAGMVAGEVRSRGLDVAP